MAQKEIIDWLEEHERKDRDDRDDFAVITADNRELKREVKALRKDVQNLQKQVQPMVTQDEHLKWAAQKVTKYLKIFLLVVSIIAAAVGLYKGIGGK